MAFYPKSRKQLARLAAKTPNSMSCCWAIVTRGNKPYYERLTYGEIELYRHARRRIVQMTPAQAKFLQEEIWRSKEDA